MKNLGRLNKLNVRSLEPKATSTELSLETLRQVTGGANSNFYAHQRTSQVCIGGQ